MDYTGIRRSLIMKNKKKSKIKFKVKPQTPAQRDKAEQVFAKIMARHGDIKESISKFQNRRVHLPPDAPPEKTITGEPEISVTKNENSFEFE